MWWPLPWLTSIANESLLALYHDFCVHQLRVLIFATKIVFQNLFDDIFAKTSAILKISQIVIWLDCVCYNPIDESQFWKVFFVMFRGPLRSICGPFVVHLWSICGPFVVHLSICGPFAVHLRSICGPFVVHCGPLWSIVVHCGPLWSICGV